MSVWEHAEPARGARLRTRSAPVILVIVVSAARAAARALTLVASIAALTFLSALGISQRAAAASGAGVSTLTYCVVGGRPLEMTVFQPAHAARPAPAVMQIHGGGWERGHRVNGLAQASAVDIGSVGTRALVAQGFVVASVGYALAPRHPWPAQMRDVACALRSLRAHAAALRIDPTRIGVLGSSAGAQLASLLAVDPAGPAWRGGPYAAFSARPDALVDEFGPVDLATSHWIPFMTTVITDVFGARPRTGSRALRAASPLYHVAADAPPTLVLQGTADNVVPPAQSRAFVQRLRAKGVPVRLVLVHGGAHGLRTPSERPTPAALASLVTRFFRAELAQR